MNVSDRIVKEVVLKAPRSRVWRALADSKEFGSWFGVAVEGAFEPGRTARARLTKPPQYEGMIFELAVVAVEPERRLAWKWHPYAVDREHDYSEEEPTLVTFTLEDHGTGTKLTVVESGFDKVPAARRAKAFEMNDGGWAAQVQNLARHVEAA